MLRAEGASQVVGREGTDAQRTQRVRVDGANRGMFTGAPFRRGRTQAVASAHPGCPMDGAARERMWLVAVLVRLLGHGFVPGGGRAVALPVDRNPICRQG